MTLYHLGHYKFKASYHGATLIQRVIYSIMTRRLQPTYCSVGSTRASLTRSSHT